MTIFVIAWMDRMNPRPALVSPDISSVCLEQEYRRVELTTEYVTVATEQTNIVARLLYLRLTVKCSVKFVIICPHVRTNAESNCLRQLFSTRE